MTLVGLVACTLAAFSAGENRLHLAHVRLEGPCAGLELIQPAGLGRTRVDAGLVAGEERSLVLPFAARPPGRPWEAVEVLAIDAPTQPPVAPGFFGPVRFDGWVEPAAGDWSTLPPGLRARPRPPVASPAATPRAAALALVAAAFALGWPLRKRRLAVLLAGVLGAAGAVLLQRIGGTEDAGVRVLEGDVASDRWLRVDASFGALAVRAGEQARVETEPAAAAMTWQVELGGDRERWVALAPGARLFALTSFEPARSPLAGLLGSEGAGRGPGFAAVWLRRADGSWSSPGPWRAGDPFPVADSNRGDSPPGWLAAGAPPGRTVLVGRLDAPGPTSWVRVTGFVPGPGIRESR